MQVEFSVPRRTPGRAPLPFFARDACPDPGSPVSPSSTVRDVVVHDLADLVRATTPPRPDPVSGRYRDTAVYRGLSDAAWPLLTSLDRLGGPPFHAKAHLEDHLLRHFQRLARALLDPVPGSRWELLIVAQHHGLPTRLLDWTFSPLVAAHFATLGPEPRRDAVVWRLDWSRMQERLGLSRIAYTVPDLEAAERDPAHPLGARFAAAGREGRHLAFLIEPPSLHPRLVAQGAAFTVSSDATRPFDRFLAEEGLADVLTRIVVPADRVDLVRDQLDAANVAEGRLFPDLDGVAREIARWYAATPRPARDSRD